jgi:N-acetylmuramoyl-L-alanine amidase
MKYTTVILLALLSILILSFVHTNTKTYTTLKTIILDAGHGGSDPGADCWEGECNEAAITLGVTLKLGDTLKKLLPDLTIHYTRTDDSYPTLKYRANFANEKKGDLFVSIHCNSASAHSKKEFTGYKTVTSYVGKGKKRKAITKEIAQYKTVKVPNPAQGMETYVWIPGKNAQKYDAIAKKENAEIFKDPNYKITYGGGLDLNSPEFIAKAKLRTKKYFTRSTMLANLVQEEGANAGRNDRNVKQRGVGIWVLQETAMPSVLVETGYISNPIEATYLNSEDGQIEMAALIAKAIVRYKEELDKKLNNSNNSDDNKNTDSTISPIAAILTKINKKHLLLS